MAVKDSQEGPRLVWRQKPEQQQWLEAREGAYLLRTNLTVDGVFRSLEKVHAADGSRSGISHAQERVGHPAAVPSTGKAGEGAHVLVAFLGYALQVTLKHLLTRSSSEYSPAQALKRLSELYSVDIVLPTVEGREIWLRRITKREEDQERLLNQLRLELPERLEPIQILKCSADSAIA